MAEPLPKAAYVGVGRSNGKTDVLDALKYAMEPLSKLSVRPYITNVKFNPPATIVFWSDKTKTVVKAQDDEPFDPEKGLAMAMVKKYLGNKGSYFNVISKWTKEYSESLEAVKIGEECAKGFAHSSPLADVAETIRRAFANQFREETFVPQPMVIESGADLINTVNDLNDIIVRNGYATVQDYYDLVGYYSVEDCSKYGWKKDPTFTVTIDKYGYCLKLSEAKLLEGVD